MRARPGVVCLVSIREPRARDRKQIHRDKGGVCSEHAFSGTSWTALTLEVGKSPTEVPPRRRLPVALPSAISEFASSSSPSWSPNRAVLDDGRQHGEQDQEARARPALGACATRPGHAVNMFVG